MSSILTLDDDINAHNFIATDWIGVGLRYSSELPGHVQHAKNLAVTTPDYFQSYFPSTDLPVLQFLALRLPKESAAVTSLKAELWFSEILPMVDAKVLYTRDIPHRKLLKQLDSLLPQAWMDGAKSIADPRYNDGTTHIPLWAVSFWKRLAVLRDNQGKWRESLGWLENMANRRSGSTYQQAKRAASMAIEVLSVMGWNARLQY